MTTFRNNRSTVARIDRCRRLRRDATDAEKRLGWMLRGRRLGYTFRRQHEYGPYILDFVCVEARLVIEADGGQHGGAAAIAYERSRDVYLAARGFRVLRFTNREILLEALAVEAVIERELHESAARVAR